jgi:FkbM family methyltransferase
MSVVDVGANIGYYTMLAASLVGKDGSVTAFEPNSENARLILLSVEQNGFSQVNVIPLALSNKTGSAFFSPHMGSNGGLLPGTEESLMNPQCIVVPTMRMDDILANRVDFIKVDTEGAEGLILAGATRIIDRDRPIISSEFSPEMLARVSGVDAFEFLMSFKRRDYRIMTLDRSAGQDAEVELDDVPAFIRNYGSPTRIEEIVFVP